MASVDDSNDTFPTGRMEALTDGVFAIAMTLLILDIKVSDFGHVATNAELLSALRAEGDALLSFVISFLMLGSLWAVHTRQFAYITHTDRHLTMINTLRLLAVVFLPLTTSISSEYSHLELGRMLLPLNFLVIIALGYWQWLYATNGKHDLAVKMSKSVKEYAKLRNLAILILAIVVTVLSVFIGPWAFLLFILTPYAMKFPGLRKLAEVG
jgi:uncharacterized membrane protein